MKDKEVNAELTDERLYELNKLRSSKNRRYRFRLILLQWLPILFFYSFFGLVPFIVLSIRLGAFPAEMVIYLYFSSSSRFSSTTLIRKLFFPFFSTSTPEE